MINLSKANYLLSDIEILNNIVKFIHDNVGGQDWETHIEDISSYIAAGIHWEEKEVIEYMTLRIK